MGLARDGYLVSRAVVRVLGDSTRTHEIHRVEEITGRPAYRRLLASLRGEPAGRRILAERPELSSDKVDYERLRRLPEATLGGAYVRHLDRNGLSADYQAAATRHVDDPDIAYLMRRFRQTHDVWHALLGLGVAGHEEVVIHAFSWGQLHLPVSAMVVLFGTLKHIVGERRWAPSGTRCARRTRSAARPRRSCRWSGRTAGPSRSTRCARVTACACSSGAGWTEINWRGS